VVWSLRIVAFKDGSEVRYMIRKYHCPRIENGLPCGDPNCVPCAKNMAYETGWRDCLTSVQARNVLTAEQSISLQDPR
jgi:hypothetical protein